MSLNVVVILIVLLVLVVVLLTMVSRGGGNFTDFGGDNIAVGDDVSVCEKLCWECCRGLISNCDDLLSTLSRLHRRCLLRK